ncbi:hypothetical protein M0802_005242 [Mischocyttarus mexicanus]|nr:hypothetical protein M0802_005242 [Mischocyttarus mexicanus]
MMYVDNGDEDDDDDDKVYDKNEDITMTKITTIMTMTMTMTMTTTKTTTTMRTRTRTGTTTGTTPRGGCTETPWWGSDSRPHSPPLEMISVATRSREPQQHDYARCPSDANQKLRGNVQEHNGVSL